MRAVNADDVELERPLQTLENIIVHGQGNAGDVVVLPLAELKLTKNIDVSLMETAVCNIVIRHPNLRAIFIEDEKDRSKEKRFSMVFLKAEVALEKFKFFEHAVLDEWSIEFAENQSRRIPGVGPGMQQFRVILATLKSSRLAYLMLFYNHAIADGMSGPIILNDILHRYTESLLGEAANEKAGTIVPTLPELNNTKELPSKNVDALVNLLNSQQSNYSQAIPTACDRSGKCHPNGFICTKGSEEGSAALLAKCREESTTVGMALLAAVYWTIAQLDTQNRKPPVMNIDVDLRSRFVCNNIKNRGVGLIIGMSNVCRRAVINDDDDFWTYARRLEGELKRGLSENEHFVFHHAIQQRWVEDAPDSKDMNFSSMGMYPFPTRFHNSGIELTGYWTPGDGWCPAMFGTMVFLSNGLPSGQCYCMVFEDMGENRKLAANMVDKIQRLCEDVAIQAKPLIFKDYIE